MNRRMIFYTVGRIITLEAGLLLLPMAVALWYGESCAWDLLASAAIALVVGLHLWKRQILLSIAGGTVCYMLLVQFLFR